MSALCYVCNRPICRHAELPYGTMYTVMPSAEGHTAIKHKNENTNVPVGLWLIDVWQHWRSVVCPWEIMPHCYDSREIRCRAGRQVVESNNNDVDDDNNDNNNSHYCVPSLKRIIWLLKYEQQWRQTDNSNFWLFFGNLLYCVSFIESSSQKRQNRLKNAECQCQCQSWIYIAQSHEASLLRCVYSVVTQK